MKYDHSFNKRAEGKGRLQGKPRKIIFSKSVLILLALCSLSFSGNAAAGPDQSVQTVAQADLAAQLNPEGIIVTVGGYRRWITGFDDALKIPSSYLQTGLALGTTPAFGRGSVYAEWLAAVFARLRVQYDLYRFYGTNSSLLSFPSATAPFGRAEVAALEGKEEAGNGGRLLIRPTLYANAGPLIIVNQTDLAYFRFNGEGPYFLEWTYETLLGNGDRVVENRTSFLFRFLEGEGDVALLAGPYYEILQGAVERLDRRRAGIMAYWVPWNTYGQLKSPRFYGQVAYYLDDPNREGEFMTSFGVGFDLEL